MKKTKLILPLLIVVAFAAALFPCNFVAATSQTLGNTNAESNAVTLNGNNVWVFGPYTPTINGTVDRILIYARAYSGAGASVKGVIYGDTAGLPGALIATQSNTTAITSTSEAWYTLALPQTVLNASSPYWLGVSVGGADSIYGYNTANAAYHAKYAAGTVPPNPFSGTNSTTGLFSIYTTLTNNDTLTYSNVAVNSTYLGTTTKFSTQWATNGSLSHYIFGWNFTGTFTNETAAFTGTWSNITKSLGTNTYMNGDVIAWQIWANNTGGKTNTTGLQTFNLYAGPELFTFHGSYHEDTGVYLAPVNVTAYFASASAQTFTVTEERTVGFTEVPLYCSYDLSPEPRQYWFAPTDSGTSLYIYNAATTGYVINFLDYTGVSSTYQYITAKTNTNGAYITVEKRKLDVQKSVAMALVEGKKYQIELSDSSGNTYVYGDLLMTATTGVQLTLRSADFPKENLLTQKNVHIYATRNFTTPTGYITVYYADSLNQTTNVALTINFANGSTAYSTTLTNSSFTLNWMNADNSTEYTLTATITHTLYGTLTWRQVFMAAGQTDPPFSLGWFGSFPFNSAYLLPALIILFVAGCFSALNAEVGAVLVCIVAIILTWMGWIPIPAGSLVAGLFFAILMALIYNKRRVIIY